MKITYKTTKYACYFGYITQAVVNNFTPLLFVIFAKEFGLSVTQIGSLITINFITQMCVDVFGANFAEKIGYRRILAASQATAALGMILLGILPFIMNHYEGIVLSSIVFAIGSGLTEVMVSPVVEALPGDAKAASMSLLHSFYCWGQVYTVIIATLYFNVFGVHNWRYLSFFWAVLPIITMVLFMIVPINVFSGEHEERTGIGNLLKSGKFWVFVFLMICSGASEISIAQWASMFAETSLGVSKNMGDLLGPCSFAVFMGIARTLYGKYGEKMDIKKSLTLTGILCVIGYLTATVPENPYVNLAGCGICGFSVGIMWPGVLSIAAGSFPKGGAALFGLLALSGDIGCATGPEVVAAVSKLGTLKTGIFAAALFPAAFVILTMILRFLKKK